MPKCKIIVYHYVRPLKTSSYPNIRGLELSLFEKQINYFQNNFNFISVSELLDCIYNNTTLSENSLLLTFDDGYKEHFSHVFPFLKKQNIPAAFFPTGNAINENIVLDTNKIHYILAVSKDTKQIIKKITSYIEDYKNEFLLKNIDWYWKNLINNNRYDNKEIIFIKSLHQRNLPKKLREIIINNLFTEIVTNDEKTFSKQLYLSFNEINEMRESGMYFGSHAYSHDWLSFMSEDELKNEFEKTSEFYSKINTSSNDWIMAYPYGDFNENVIKIMEKFNFKAGMTTIPNDTNLIKNNAFTLERYDTNDFPQ